MMKIQKIFQSYKEIFLMNSVIMIEVKRIACKIAKEIMEIQQQRGESLYEL